MKPISDEVSSNQRTCCQLHRGGGDPGNHKIYRIEVGKFGGKYWVRRGDCHSQSVRRVEYAVYACMHVKYPMPYHGHGAISTGAV